MDKFNRIWRLHQEFSNRRFPVKIVDLAKQLNCCEKTVKRTLKQMQTDLNAPLEYVAEYHGWRYDPENEEKFELPGLWMGEDELVSLLLLLSILETFGNGLLNDDIQRANLYISKLLKDRGFVRDEIVTKLKVLPIAQKILPSKMLYTVSEALFKNRRAYIHYVDFKNCKSERLISPQTLVYYRDNWYIDAWCHLRESLRTFTIARISNISLTEEKGETIAPELLKQHFSNSYGIFAGQPTQVAKLKFSPSVAKEISMQCWHKKQTSGWKDGFYLLDIPYDKDDELIMDIMRYLPHVEVLEPASLRAVVIQRIQKSYELFCK